MEGTVLAEPEVRAVLEKFVVAKLYTDPGSALNEANQAFQRERFKNPALPLYVAVGPDDQVRSKLAGLATKAEFLAFLEKGRSVPNSTK